MTCLIDTHCHICDSSFDNDRKEVLEKANSSGVKSIIAVGENLEDAKKNIELAGVFPSLLPAAGLYPSFTDLDQARELVSFIRDHACMFHAIGEVGLDFRVVEEDSLRKVQAEIFCMFIDLAMELDLPLNVHSRSAGRHAIDLLVGKKAQKVQMHAFGGKFSSAERGVAAGYFFSIPPSIVRSRQKQKLVKALPLSCIMAETDSPVLGPDPAGRNEPSNITCVIDEIARIREMDPSEVASIIEENTRRLYPGC